MSNSFFCSCFLNFIVRSDSALIYRCFAFNCKVNKFIRFIDSVRNLSLNKLLSVKSFHWNFGICRNNDKISFFNIFICKYIFGTAGTSCLYLDITILCLCCFFKSLSRHISMGDSCRTGCNCKYFYLAIVCFSNIRKSFVHTFLFFISLIYYFKKLFCC